MNGSTPPIKKSRRLSKTYWLSVASAIGILVINTVGFTDTITGSALGCGHDWPLCNGQVIPSRWDMATFIEYTHRISVLAGGVLLIWLAVVAWKKYKKVSHVRTLISLSLAGVLAEGVLGALSVIFLNPPAVMAAHLGIALISFVAVVLLSDLIRKWDRRETVRVILGGNRSLQKDTLRIRHERNFARLAWWSIPYGYLAIYVGAYVASSGDGAFFQGWPIPTEVYAVVGNAFWIDILHRTIALGYLIWMGYLVWASYRLRRISPLYFAVSCVAFVFVCLQALTGYFLIETHLSTIAFLLHVTNVTLLFTTQCYLGFSLLEEQPEWRNNGKRVQQLLKDPLPGRTS